MRARKPDENGTVTVKGILTEGISDAFVYQPPCDCCGSTRQWSLYWLPEEWKDHTVVVTVRLATPEEL